MLFDRARLVYWHHLSTGAPMKKPLPISALCQAAANGDLSAVKKILDSGTSANGRAEFNKTPLMFAAQHGQAAAASLLIRAGARLELVDSDNETALVYAARGEGSTQQGFRTVQTLLQAGARGDVCDEFGLPASHIMCLSGSLGQLSDLVVVGLPVTQKERHDRNVFHAMAEWGYENKEAAQIIRFLVDKGVDLHGKDDQGRAPSDLATARGHQKLAQMLKDCFPVDPQAAARPRPSRPG